MKLFCLPSAGAQASMYHDMKKALEGEIQIIPIEYPGHGFRIGEPLINTMEQLCNECIKMIELALDYQNEPFMVLGHSMGAMLGYQMEEKLRQKGDNIEKLILCACQAPNFWIDYIADIENMSDDEFLEYVSSLGGIPEELVDNAFFKDIYTHIIRNDFMMIKKHIPNISVVSTPIVFINGTRDKLVGERWRFWKCFVKSEQSFYELEENHFLTKNTNAICDILRKELIVSKEIYKAPCEL